MPSVWLFFCWDSVLDYSDSESHPRTTFKETSFVNSTSSDKSNFAMDIIDRMQTAAAYFGNEPLLELGDGKVITLVSGYVPLLANFTFEDKAAKRLRKGKVDNTPELSIYYSALGVVRDSKVILLNGPSGSGKTSFAKHLRSS